jgi:hypothetical protein
MRRKRLRAMRCDRGHAPRIVGRGRRSASAGAGAANTTMPEAAGFGPFWAAQALALVAALIEFTAYRFPDNRRLFLYLIVSNVLVGTHFLLLAQPIAAIGVYMAALRFAVARRWQARWLPYAFFAVPVVSVVLLYRAPIDLLPVAAAYFLIFGTYKRDPLAVRRHFLVGNSLWLVYDLYVYAFVMAVVEFSAAAGNLFFLLRRRASAAA